MSAPPPPAAPSTTPNATSEVPVVLPEAAGATPAAAAPGAAAPAAAAAAGGEPDGPQEKVATANDPEAAAAAEQAASEARGGTTGSPDAFPSDMSLEDRLRREPSEKVNDADILFTQVVGSKLVLYNHKPLETESGDRVMGLFACVAEKPAAYNAPVRIQNTIYPLNVFKVVKEWKDCISSLLLDGSYRQWQRKRGRVHGAGERERVVLRWDRGYARVQAVPCGADDGLRRLARRRSRIRERVGRGQEEGPWRAAR